MTVLAIGAMVLAPAIRVEQRLFNRINEVEEGADQSEARLSKRIDEVDKRAERSDTYRAEIHKIFLDALTARVDRLENRLDRRVDRLDSRLDERIREVKDRCDRDKH